MHTHRFVVSTLAMFMLCAWVPAQTDKNISQPSGYTRLEGNSRATVFGTYADARTMIVEQDLKDGVRRQLSSVSLRRDSTFAYNGSSIGQGRSWSQVKLSLAPSTGAISSTYSANLAAKATLVFSGKVSWPTLNAKTKGGNPDPWGGGTSKPYRFAFGAGGAATTYPHDGTKNGLVGDYLFSGGALTNGASWADFTLSNYSHDSHSVTTTVLCSRVLGRLPAKAGSCNDPRINLGFGATTNCSACAYGQSYNVVGWRGKLRVLSSSFYTNPQGAVVRAFGLKSVTAGVNVGARCNLLYVDLASPNLIISHPIKGVNTTNGFSGLYEIITDLPDVLEGQTITVQTAWNNSRKSYLSLTDAVQLRLPANPAARAPRRGYLQHWKPLSAVAADWSATCSDCVPLFYYEGN